MCNIEQCSRCRLNFDTCGCYDDTVTTPCSHFVNPIDNTKMFNRWYKFTGLIGRLEYSIMLVIAVVLYLLLLHGIGAILRVNGIFIGSVIGLYLLAYGCMLPSIYIVIVAGIKRAHDSGVSSWYSLVPLIPLFFLNIITFILFCAGCVFLFKDKGEEGVNEHGSNPTEPYNEQIRIAE